MVRPSPITREFPQANIRFAFSSMLAAAFVTNFNFSNFTGPQILKDTISVKSIPPSVTPVIGFCPVTVRLFEVSQLETRTVSSNTIVSPSSTSSNAFCIAFTGEAALPVPSELPFMLDT